MQLGFVIDQSRCIGCHACTVACKSENDVPVGDFRTWVKYTEDGTFPSVKRSFAVLRCNQCTAAPCVTICPTGALEKRPDGIVDVNPASCIGCKSCMHGCPYDALYIGEGGTAEKCHFCAHRTERGLAPACAVVCPTEAIIPGDFDDPGSIVSRMKREFDLTVRKPEAGTRPNVMYRDAAAACIDPNLTNGAGGQIWADRHPKIDHASVAFDATAMPGETLAPKARTTLSTAHPQLWGWKITGYLFAKSLAAGVVLAAGFAGIAPISPGKPFTADKSGIEAVRDVAQEIAGEGSVWADASVALLGLLFLTITSALLVFDLKRPERFFYILARPNFSSWLVRGTYFLMALGALLTAWGAIAFGEVELGSGAHWGLFGATAIVAGLAACYTGWLFGQAKGRVLWMRRGLWLHLIVQAFVAGAAFLLLLSPLGWFGPDAAAGLSRVLASALGLHGLFTALEGHMAPKGREEEYHRVHRLIAKGPFAAQHWRLGVYLGIIAPLVLLAFPASPLLATTAAAMALVGLYVEEDIMVRAGQALPIS